MLLFFYEISSKAFRRLFTNVPTVAIERFCSCPIIFTMALPTMTPSQVNEILSRLLNGHLFHLFGRGNTKTNTIWDRGMLFYCIKKTVKISLECISDTGNAGRGYAIQKSFTVCRNGSNTVFRRWGDKINWIHAMSVSTFINFVMFFKRKVRHNDGINSCFLT